jgi:uncharacterized protein
MAGQLVHFEISAKDTKKAREFYAELFGWKFDDVWQGGDYYTTKAGGDPGGAINGMTPVAKGIAIYFDTDDIDESVRRVRELGGKAEDKRPIPEIGWFSACRDLDGNEFALYQDDPSVKAEEQQTETPSARGG